MFKGIDIIANVKKSDKNQQVTRRQEYHFLFTNLIPPSIFDLISGVRAKKLSNRFAQQKEWKDTEGSSPAAFKDPRRQKETK